MKSKDGKMKAKKLLKRKIPARYLVFFMAFALLIGLHLYGLLDYTSVPRNMHSVRNQGGSERKIYIQPFGKIEEKTLAYTVQFIEEDTGLKVQILPEMKVSLPREGRKNQLNAEILLNLITDKKSLPKDCFRIIGLTSYDLYVENLNFVFGLGTLPGMGCVLSLNRLYPTDENYLPIKHLNEKQIELYKLRIRKLIRHELGHSFGLYHCYRHKCVMRFANSLEEADAFGEYYCTYCSRILSATSRLN
jgi:predicted Zn-dependent protease